LFRLTPPMPDQKTKVYLEWGKAKANKYYFENGVKLNKSEIAARFPQFTFLQPASYKKADIEVYPDDAKAPLHKVKDAEILTFSEFKAKYGDGSASAAVAASGTGDGSSGVKTEGGSTTVTIAMPAKDPQRVITEAEKDTRDLVQEDSERTKQNELRKKAAPLAKTYAVAFQFQDQSNLPKLSADAKNLILTSFFMDVLSGVYVTKSLADLTPSLTKSNKATVRVISEAVSGKGKNAVKTSRFVYDITWPGGKPIYVGDTGHQYVNVGYTSSGQPFSVETKQTGDDSTKLSNDDHMLKAGSL